MQKPAPHRAVAICLLLAALGSDAPAGPEITDRGTALQGHAQAADLKAIAACAEMVAASSSPKTALRTSVESANKAVTAVCQGDKVRAQHISLCISTTVSNPADPDSRLAPGEFEPGHFDSECKRQSPAKVVMRLDEIKRRAGEDNSPPKNYLEVTVWYHEWCHTEQTSPIETSLDKMCFDNLSDSGLTPKQTKAVDLAVQAVNAERAYNEFEAQYKELCALADLCDAEAGTISGAKKRHMKDKLSQLCQRLKKSCETFEMAYAEYTQALIDFVHDPANQDCVDVVDGAPVATVTITNNKTDADGDDTEATATVTLKLTEYQNTLDGYNEEKNKKTDDPDGEGPMTSPLQMKKDAITERYDC